MLRDDVLDFIRSLIKTVWSLELLLLARADANRIWSAEDLVKELRSSAKVVSESLAVFTAAGILREVEGGVVYAPAAGDLTFTIDELAREYRERPSAVINAIVDAQSSKLQAFANAFRIKRD